MCSDSFVFTSKAPEESFKLGELLGENAYGGLLIALYGGLGMGKTVLTQGIGSALGLKKIKSPTFIIVNEYGGDLPLIHADLYRIENSGGVDSLDLEYYLDEGCLVVVEWAERWKEIPSDDVIKIEFNGNYDEERQLTITAMGEKAVAALTKVKKKTGMIGENK